MPQAGNPMTRSNAVIRITLPQIQRPVGRGRSSADGPCGGGRLAFGLSSGFGSVIVLFYGVSACSRNSGFGHLCTLANVFQGYLY